MSILTFESLENVINKIYTPTFREHLRNKYQLRELGDDWEKFNDIEFYAKRNLVVGINGEIFKHKTTGPCLLPSTDINMLSNKKLDDEKIRFILDKQPTLQNVLLNGIAARGPIHVCLETKEFTNLLSDLTNRNHDYLEEFIKIAQRTWKMTRNLVNWWNVQNSEIHLHYTHEPRVDETIKANCTEYYQRYIQFLLSHDPKSNYHRIGLRLKKFLELGKKPEDIYRLRVVSTYFPGWWGDESVHEHTIVENVFHDAWLFTKLYSKTSMVALLPPKDLSFKKSEMDVGVPLYLGTENGIKEGLEILKKTRFPNKNRYNCIVGNLLLFAVKGIEDFHCIESCGRKNLNCKHDCRDCLGLLEEFLYKISGFHD